MFVGLCINSDVLLIDVLTKAIVSFIKPNVPGLPTIFWLRFWQDVNCSSPYFVSSEFKFCRERFCCKMRRTDVFQIPASCERRRADFRRDFQRRSHNDSIILGVWAENSGKLWSLLLFPTFSVSLNLAIRRSILIFFLFSFYLKPVKHLSWSFFARSVNGFQSSTTVNVIHLRCLAGFCVHLCILILLLIHNSQSFDCNPEQLKQNISIYYLRRQER